jgi:hypothetical protein
LGASEHVVKKVPANLHLFQLASRFRCDLAPTACTFAAFQADSALFHPENCRFAGFWPQGAHIRKVGLLRGTPDRSTRQAKSKNI